MRTIRMGGLPPTAYQLREIAFATDDDPRICKPALSAGFFRGSLSNREVPQQADWP